MRATIVDLPPLRLALVIASVLAGCTPGRVGTSAPPPSLTVTRYCAAASAPGLHTWSGVIQTRCPESEVDVDGPLAGCRHFRLEGDGERELPLPGVQRALEAGDGSLVLWREDGALHVRAADGTERVLAGWAADPSVGSNGSSVAYLTVADEDLEEDEHGREPVLGAPVRVVLHPLTGSPEVLVVDPDAASPWPLPDGSGVLFVSTRTGLASLWLTGRDGETQLTNVGLEEVGQEFVPVPAGELAWLSDGRAVYATSGERDELWLFDPRTGDAERLGPGSRPRVVHDEVLALGGAEGGCALRYAIGGRP